MADMPNDKRKGDEQPDDTPPAKTVKTKAEVRDVSVPRKFHRAHTPPSPQFYQQVSASRKLQLKKPDFPFEVKFIALFFKMEEGAPKVIGMHAPELVSYKYLRAIKLKPRGFGESKEE